MTLVLTILLWLLKLVGILLAVVVGLILLILLSPIRYQIDIEKTEKLIWAGRISWLFRLVQFRFQQAPAESTTEFRLFGFCLMSETEEEEPKPRKNAAKAEEDLWQTDWQSIEEEEFKRKLFDYLSNGDSKKEKIERIEEISEPPEPAFINQLAEEYPAESLSGMDEITKPMAKVYWGEEAATKGKSSLAKENARTAGEAEDYDIWAEFEAGEEERPDQKKSDRKEKNNWKGKKGVKKNTDTEAEPETNAIGEEKEQFREEIENSNEKKRAGGDKQALIDTAWWVFQKLRTYWQKNRGVIKHIFRWPWRMLRSVLPRRADGDIAFGLGDPAHTGYVLSLFYLFYPENRGKIEIAPDFENRMFAGRAAVKGRIWLMEIVYYALRLIIDIRIIRLFFLIRTLKAGKAAEEEKYRKKKNQGKDYGSGATTVLSASAER